MIGSLMGIASELPQAHGVEPHQCDDCKSEYDKREIEHDRLLAWQCPTSFRRKVTMAIGAARHKDFVKRQGFYKSCGFYWSDGGEGGYYR